MGKGEIRDIYQTVHYLIIICNLITKVSIEQDSLTQDILDHVPQRQMIVIEVEKREIKTGAIGRVETGEWCLFLIFVQYQE